MSEFTKTIIVDSNPNYSGYKTIHDAVADTDIVNNGGTIIVEQGTYTIGGDQTAMIPSNTTLIGRGNVVLEITNIDTSAFKNSDFSNGNSRIVISGFKIIVKVNDYRYHPIWLQNTNDCIVEKVYVTAVDNQETSYTIDVETNGSTAILLHGTADNKCVNNTIRQCAVVNYGKIFSGALYKYGNGIGITSSSETGKYCKRNKVINNYVKKAWYGLSMVGAVNTLVAGNIFTDSVQPLGPGIGARYCDGSSFIGNIAANNTSHGIYASRMSEFATAGNICDGNAGDGFKLNTEEVDSKYGAISGNVCCNATDGVGVLITGQGSSMSKYNAIFGNVCRNNTTEGILESPMNRVDCNNIAGNMCKDNPAQYDIYTNGPNSNKYGNIGEAYP